MPQPHNSSTIRANPLRARPALPAKGWDLPLVLLVVFQLLATPIHLLADLHHQHAAANHAADACPHSEESCSTHPADHCDRHMHEHKDAMADQVRFQVWMLAPPPSSSQVLANPRPSTQTYPEGDTRVPSSCITRTQGARAPPVR